MQNSWGFSTPSYSILTSAAPQIFWGSPRLCQVPKRMETEKGIPLFQPQNLREKSLYFLA